MEEIVTINCWTRATLDRMWDVWTTAAGLRLWWWPHLPDMTYVVDARDGGRYAVGSASAQVGARGEFLQVDRPNLLVMTWRWDDDAAAEADFPGPACTEDDLVQAQFVAQHGGTRVTVRHIIRSHNGLTGYSRGWDRALDRLARMR